MGMILRTAVAGTAALALLTSGLVGSPASALEAGDGRLIVSVPNYGPCNAGGVTPPCPQAVLYVRLKAPLAWPSGPAAGSVNVRADLTRADGREILTPSAADPATNPNVVLDGRVGHGASLFDPDPTYGGSWLVINAGQAAVAPKPIPSGRLTLTYTPPTARTVGSQYPSSAAREVFVFDYTSGERTITPPADEPGPAVAIKKKATKHTVRLTWKAPKAKGAYNAATAYKVKVGKKTKIVKSRKATIKGLKAKKRYTWTVRARNAEGWGPVKRGVVRTKK